jgi:hypothetical protein
MLHRWFLKPLDQSKVANQLVLKNQQMELQYQQEKKRLLQSDQLVQYYQ